MVDPTMKTLDTLIYLQTTYGSDITIGNLIPIFKQYAKSHGFNYRCPICQGKGYIEVPEYAGIDGRDYEPAYDKKCDLCNGYGYTEKKYEPKMIQQGWQIAEE